MTNNVLERKMTIASLLVQHLVGRYLCVDNYSLQLGLGGQDSFKDYLLVTAVDTSSDTKLLLTTHSQVLDKPSELSIERINELKFKVIDWNDLPYHEIKKTQEYLKLIKVI